jgi:hypothetical protein
MTSRFASVCAVLWFVTGCTMVKQYHLEPISGTEYFLVGKAPIYRGHILACDSDCRVAVSWTDVDGGLIFDFALAGTDALTVMRARPPFIRGVGYDCTPTGICKESLNGAYEAEHIKKVIGTPKAEVQLIERRDVGDTREDVHPAVKFHRRACDGGDMRACSNLGVMYADGAGVREDDARAVELYRQACHGGSMEGCYFLGAMYANGEGVRKDKAYAVEFYRQACDGGYQYACGRL